MTYSRDSSGDVLHAILRACTDLVNAADNAPYVVTYGGCPGTTLWGIRQAFTDLVTGDDNSPYVRNTSGTTLDGILDALTDLVTGDDNSPYVRNTKGTTWDGILDRLTDLVTGADSAPYARSSAGTTLDGILEALIEWEGGNDPLAGIIVSVAAVEPVTNPPDLNFTVANGGLLEDDVVQAGIGAQQVDFESAPLTAGEAISLNFTLINAVIPSGATIVYVRLVRDGNFGPWVASAEFTVPSVNDDWALEDDGGSWALEDDSGSWILEAN